MSHDQTPQPQHDANNPSVRRPVLIDTDPGQDDAIAILLTLGSQSLNLVGLSVTSGNVGLEKCVTNSLKLLELSGHTDIPVYTGCDRPLKNPPVFLEAVFGESGLAGGEHLPEPTIKPHASLSAADAIIATYSQPSDTILAAIAPMTNIAVALQKKPEIAQNIPKLVIMGGCPYPEPLRGEMGNIRIANSEHLAEYNFAVDPHAASIVLESGIKDIHMIGLNITRDVLYGEDMDKALRAIGTPVANTIASILSTVGEEDVDDYASVRKHAHDPVRAIHDAVALAYADSPEIFTTQQVRIHVPAEGPRAGQTLIQDDGIPMTVVIGCDHAKFQTLLLSNIARL